MNFWVPEIIFIFGSSHFPNKILKKLVQIKIRFWFIVCVFITAQILSTYLDRARKHLFYGGRFVMMASIKIELF